MDFITREMLETLATTTAEHCVSVFMPTHRAGAETQQDPIRLKNLLNDVETRLHERGVSSKAMQKLLAPAQELLSDKLFWQHQSDGLAIFLAEQDSHTFQAPYRFAEFVSVSNHYYIKPLLPFLSGDGRFYILALSQNAVRLLQGTRHSVDELPSDNLPASLAEALHEDDPEARLQFHTASGSPGTAAGRPAIFYGHGTGSDDEKQAILRYFQQIDRALSDMLNRESDVPLVLAGVDYLLPLYREANTYPHLVETGITGNPEQTSPADLHEQAWGIVAPLFRTAQDEAASRYQSLAGSSSERSSSSLQEVVPAAYHGRIDTLFVTAGQQQWGTFDPATNRVEMHQPGNGATDLLNLAVRQTLINSGQVYSLQAENMPPETDIAAIFRY